MVAQEEHEIGGGAADVPKDAGALILGSAHVLAAGPSSVARNFKRGTKRPVCTHCGLIGHAIDKCYHKIAYPPKYRTKGKVGAAVAISGANEVLPGDNNGLAPEGDSGGSGGVTISHQQYQALYFLFKGHGSVSSAWGPVLESVVSYVTMMLDQMLLHQTFSMYLLHLKDLLHQRIFLLPKGFVSTWVTSLYRVSLRQKLLFLGLPQKMSIEL
ncbi:hypothetical protein LINPERHAP1_LOCUS19204 [Linum perenne]